MSNKNRNRLIGGGIAVLLLLFTLVACNLRSSAVTNDPSTPSTSTPSAKPSKTPTPTPSASSPTATATASSTPTETTAQDVPAADDTQQVVTDYCPDGDYTGNLYDGACGQIPQAPAPQQQQQSSVTDYCPDGDYTGNSYDGACGTAPQAPEPAPPQAPVADYCPDGDYTGNSYDGACGTKPRAPYTPLPPPSTCTEGHTYTSGLTGITYRCTNGVYVQV